MIQLSTFIEVLKNHPALLDGEIAVSQEYITRRIREEVLATTTAHDIDIRIDRQQLLLRTEVGKAGLRYEYVCPFILRGADLNSTTRYVLFQQGAEKVRAANLAAKAVPFATILIPEAGFFLKTIVKVIVQEIVRHTVSKGVSNGLANFSQRAGGVWQINIDDSGLPNLLREPVEIPVVGPRRILGEIIVVRRLDFRHGKAFAKLGLHPDMESVVGMASSAASAAARHAPRASSAGLAALAPLASLLDSTTTKDRTTRSAASLFGGVVGRLPFGAIAERATASILGGEEQVESSWLKELAGVEFVAPDFFDLGTDWLDLL